MRFVHLGLGSSTLVCVAFAMMACADTDTVGGGGEGGVINVSTGVGGSGQSSSTSTTSASTSASTTSASSTSASTTTASSTSSGPPPCDDTGPSEPGNDTRAGAHSLGTINDDDDSGDSFAGVVASMSDPDWYQYEANDSFYVVDATRSSVAPGLRICKYIQCKSGNTTFNCPSNSSPDTVDGIAGCCWTGNAEVAVVDIDCSGTIDEDTTVYIRVDAPTAVDCLPYSVAFHY